MLAPFYDDLDDNGGIEPFNVFSYQDSDSHRFIIQWDNLPNGEKADTCILGDDTSCPKETFQLILFDPDYYTTDTGDGIIKFQYKEVYNVDDHGCTIGIESSDKNRGVEYVFNQDYHPDASPWNPLDESLGWGNYGFSMEELAIEFRTSSNIVGDANYDEYINILDLVMIVINIVEGLSYEFILDYNQDSVVDVLDVISMINDIVEG